ncbi:MAG: hypothetical protein AMXMBFR7_05830 [Planctomycetota bacterium]
MKHAQIDEILHTLPRPRQVYHYFRDRYALELLAWACGEGRKIADLKCASEARFLQKPAVKAVLSRCGGGTLSALDLQSWWPPDYQTYMLTFGRHGLERKRSRRECEQISRRGQNLVLKLCLTRAHDAFCKKLLGPERMVHYWSHFSDEGGLPVLAWTRLDVELDDDEVLIEELQNDWIRDVVRERRHEGPMTPEVWRTGGKYSWWFGLNRRELERYYAEVIEPHLKIWDEALLLATLLFVRNELGVRRVYYHTPSSSNVLKRFSRYWHPPRSLYTELPRRFGFRETLAPPKMVARAAGRRFDRARREGRVGWFFREL